MSPDPAGDGTVRRRRLDGIRTRVGDLRSDFAPSSIPGTLAGGLVTGFVAVAVTLSFAALVFTGPLEEHLPLGIGLALFGSAVIGLITAFGSAFRVALAGAQDNVAAILAVAVAAITARVAGDDALPTALATIIVASIGMGILLYAIGRLRVGGLVRYMPYPVVGGFLAATGVLLVDGGATVLFAGRAGSDLLSTSAVMVWGPGVAVAVGMYLSGRLRPGSLLTPVFLLAAIAVMRVGFVVFGVGRDEAMARTWLFGPFPGDVSWSPRSMRMLADADWGAVGGEWVSLLTIGVIAAVSLLLYVHALEHVTSSEVDVDRELRVAGVAGIASGAGGGFPGFLYLSDSSLLHRITGPRRGAAIIGASVNAGVLLVGTAILDLVPRAVVGGVLVGIGLFFIVEWLWDARVSLGRVDHALVVVIAAATLIAGFLAAIAVGVVIAIILFVVRYSRVEVTRRIYSLDRTSSTVERPRHQREALATHGAAVRVIEVRGFLFFGTATALFDESRLIADTGAPPLKYVVFDMKGVVGLDSSMTMAFPRLDRAAVRREVVLVFAGVRPKLRPRVEAAVAGGDCRVEILEDLDTALVWCEDRILDEALGSHEIPESADLSVLLADILGVGGSEAVLRHAETVNVAPGVRLISAGDPAGGLYFLESGRMRVVLERSGREPALLRQLHPGAVIGEVGVYRGETVSATVMADTDCVLKRLSTTGIAILDRADPAAAAAVHRFAASVLADRVLHAERAIRSSG
jgi:sulfate permease, SulP family